MALTAFQKALCHLLARNRIESGQSYVAGGAALNQTLQSGRLSRDVDVFHDTLEALDATWQSDRVLLQQDGYRLDVVRERSGFVEAEVWRDEQSVLVQWVRDSAFRFFPLQPSEEFGLTLHPLDLATNKMLALVGRQETRDWVDALICHQQVAPLGLLAWAACGKDEGWNPSLILDEAARNARTSREEWQEIEWQGEPPDLPTLKLQWREALAKAREIVALLPIEHVGTAVLKQSGEVFRVSIDELIQSLASNQLLFHAGHIGGAWPQLKI